MKRGTVIAGFEVHTEQGPRTIPAGACWVIEGALWVKIVWQAEGERPTATLSLRDYQACVQRGCIHFSAEPSVDWTVRHSRFPMSSMRVLT